MPVQAGAPMPEPRTPLSFAQALARLGRVTSLARKPVDASLGFAVAGALAMLAAFLAGFGLGRYP